MAVIDRGLFLSFLASTIVALYVVFRFSGNMLNDIDVRYFGVTTTGTVTNVEVLPLGENGEEVGCIDYWFDALGHTISSGIRVHPDRINDKMFFVGRRAHTFVTYSKIYPKHHWISGTKRDRPGLIDLVMSTVFFLFGFGLLLIMAGFAGVSALYLMGTIFLKRDDLIETVFTRKRPA